MGILQDLFLVGINKEENIPPVSGDTHSTYHFSFTRNQWIRGLKIEHEVEGIVEVGICPYNKTFFKWSIAFKNIECRKKENFLPEYYLFWDYIQRADFLIHINGKIAEYNFKTYGIDTAYKQKIKKCSDYLENGRRNTVQSDLKKIKKDPSLQMKLLRENPVIQFLSKEFKFHIQFKSQKDKQVLNSSYSNEILESYFGENFHLPIKKYNLLDKSKENLILGSCIGGLDKEKMNETDFYRYMKRLAGKVTIGRELLVDYSEYYQYDPKAFIKSYDFLKAESYLQTIIAEAWFLEEQIVLNKI